MARVTLNRTAVVLVVVLLTVWPAAAASGDVAFFDGFEEGTLTSDWEDNSGSSASSHGVNSDRAYNGTYSFDAYSVAGSDTEVSIATVKEASVPYPTRFTVYANKYHDEGDENDYRIRLIDRQSSATLTISESGSKNPRIIAKDKNGTTTNDTAIANSQLSTGVWTNATMEFNGTKVTAYLGNDSVTIDTTVNWQMTDVRVVLITNGWDGVNLHDIGVAYDDVTVLSDAEELSGDVTDRNDNAIENATVTARQNGTVIDETTTNKAGEYQMMLPSGQYNVTANKTDYHPKTHTVTISDTNESQSFVLVEKDKNLVIDTSQFLQHGEKREYTIYYYERNKNTTELERFDVTADANVTSNNTKAITVDATNHELVATANESINAKVLITAEYQRDNETFTAEQNVTVANLTLDNIKILPGPYRISATFSSPPDSDANPMLVIIIATLVGIVGVRASTSFGGLSLMTMAVMVAWFGGFISHGMMLVTIVTATFIGLNVAANINYGIHR